MLQNLLHAGRRSVQTSSSRASKSQKRQNRSVAPLQDPEAVLKAQLRAQIVGFAAKWAEFHV